jgi:hypothetical protein
LSNDSAVIVVFFFFSAASFWAWNSSWWSVLNNPVELALYEKPA